MEVRHAQSDQWKEVAALALLLWPSHSKEELERELARDLLARCEGWSREKGCREMGSDCSLDNLDSQRFHLGSGFHEAGQIRCFIKPLGE